MTPQQLKTTNLIFSEHSFLLQENALLKDELNYLEELNSNLNKLDSSNYLEIQLLQKKTLDYNNTINSLQKKLNRKKKTNNILIGSTIIIGSLLVYFIVK